VTAHPEGAAWPRHDAMFSLLPAMVVGLGTTWPQKHQK
jgi:hypothetical protein